MKTLLKVRQRRAVERQPTNWRARYMVEEHPELGWGQCHVVDASFSGAGLELFGPAVDDNVGEHVVLELQVVEQVARLCVRGTIRNTSSGPDGGVRVGVEFDRMTDVERAILGLLLKQHA